MTSPTLPPFITTASQLAAKPPRYVPRSNRQLPTTPPLPRPSLDTHQPNFFERHGSFISFLWATGLICALVRAAFS